MLKALIVDDEPKGQRILNALCKEYCGDIEIVGVAGSVPEASEMVNSFHPDLVFLDIQMPLQNGFELLEEFEDNLPFEVIITSAYEKYAPQAYKTPASDYLLKPIEIDELVFAVNKVKKKLSTEEETKFSEIKNQESNVEKIALTTIDGFIFVRFENIVRCAAEGNYTKVLLDDGTSLLITKTLKHYEELLKDKDFFRVHKSHLINLNYVRKFIKGKQSFVETLDGETIEVSARKRESLLKSLSNIKEQPGK